MGSIGKILDSLGWSKPKEIKMFWEFLVVMGLNGIIFCLIALLAEGLT